MFIGVNLRKFFLILLIFFIFSGFVFSQNVQEYDLSEFGLEQITVSDEYSTVCQKIFLPGNIFPKDANLFPVISLFVDFEGDVSDNSFVSISTNGSDRQVFWRENFVCEPDCVARHIPLKKDFNNIELCVRTNIFPVVLEEYSKIGFYETPVLTIESISPGSIILGEQAEMVVVIENMGSKSADVFIQFMADDLRALLEITSFDIVSGQTSSSAIISPNSSKKFSFFIKPSLLGSYNLPASELVFKNIFGEKQRKTSNHPQLSVIEPDQLDIFLLVRGIEDNKFHFDIVIKNNWDSYFDGNLTIFPTGTTEFEDSSLVISPLSERVISVESLQLPPGNYSLFVSIDSNDFSYESEQISFVIKKEDYFFEIVFSVIAILFALGIFGFIYFGKKNE